VNGTHNVLKLLILLQTKCGMHPSSDQQSPSKLRLTAQQRQIRLANRRTITCLRIAIGQVLDERGITTPAEIGSAVGMPPEDAVMLVKRELSPDVNVATLEAVAINLGLSLPLPPLVPWRS
jgi:hypothetical protein